MRVAGKGQPGANGGKPGDLYLRVTIAPDTVFRRQGSDIHVSLPVFPWEAALGAEVMAPTLMEPVRVKVPPGSRADSKLRLKGKGLPAATGGHGDLFLDDPDCDASLIDRRRVQTLRPTQGHRAPGPARRTDRPGSTPSTPLTLTNRMLKKFSSARKPLFGLFGLFRLFG